MEEKIINAQEEVNSLVEKALKALDEFQGLNQEQIELTLDDKNMLSIKYTDSIGKIQCLNANEFPQIKQLEDCSYFEMKEKDFNTLLKHIEINV